MKLQSRITRRICSRLLVTVVMVLVMSGCGTSWAVTSALGNAAALQADTPTAETTTRVSGTTEPTTQTTATPGTATPGQATAQPTTAAPGAQNDTLGAQTAQPPDTNTWPNYGYTPEQTRHVSLEQITKDNVRDLGVVWSTDLQEIDKSIPGGQEAVPLIVHNTLYTTTSFDHVLALDAVTGELRWHFVPGEIGKFQNFGLNVNRGLAYCNGVLYMLTLDMRIMAINASNGQLIKQVNIADSIPDARPEYGYYQTQAPVCYNGRLVIGSSGGDNGARGFVMAYNANDLSPAWPGPYWTVPPAGQDWRSQGRFHGGGAVWMTPTIDTTTDIVYFSVGNPSPDFFPQLRPGNNPNTNSLIAVDLATGEERWVQQQLANDQWDYDTGQSPMVYTAQINGKARRVVSVGNKEGMWFAYDAATGDPIYTNVQVVNESDHPQLQQGEPIEISPGTLGGVNYAPQSYDPTTNYTFVAVAETKVLLMQVESAEQVDKERARGDVDTGAINGFGNVPEGWHDYGSVNAIDMDTGKVAWRFDTPEPERGGTTTTSTGLAFIGGGDGNLRAFDTSTGAVLWQFQTGAPIAAAPAIYQIGGTEYIAITVGGTSTSSGGGDVSQVMVFALGGEKMQRAAPGFSQEGITADKLRQQAERARNQADASDFISLGDEPRTVNITLNAAYDNTNGGLNFNGYANGEATYRVPEGWTVNVTFKNLSSQSPHSAVVVADGSQNKVRIGPPIFPGASTPDPEAGITSGTQVFTFTAGQQGRYVFACGIPGHAQAGHWIRFEIGAPDSQPSLTLGNQPVYTPGKENETPQPDNGTTTPTVQGTSTTGTPGATTPTVGQATSTTPETTMTTTSGTPNPTMGTPTATASGNPSP